MLVPPRSRDSRLDRGRLAGFVLGISKGRIFPVGGLGEAGDVLVSRVVGDGRG